MPKSTFFNLPDDKRALILDVALDEFANNDYDGVSINRLVTRAGISKGSFYQYFEDKADLFMHLMEVLGRRKMTYLGSADTAPGSDLFDWLRRLTAVGIAFEMDHPQVAQLGYRLVGGGNYPPAWVEQAQQGTLAFYRQLAQRGKLEGSIRPNLDDELVAWLFGTVFNNLGRFLYARLSDAEWAALRGGGHFFDVPALRDLFDQTIAVLERGLGGEPDGGVS